MQGVAQRVVDGEVVVGKMYKVITAEGLITVRIAERRLVDDWKQDGGKVWLYAGVNMLTGKVRVFRAYTIRRETGFAPTRKQGRVSRV